MKGQDTLPSNRGSRKSVGGLTPLVLFINNYNQRDFNPWKESKKKKLRKEALMAFTRMQVFLGFTISSILKSFLVHFSSLMSAQNQQVFKHPLLLDKKN